jgi:hypothetical protein
MPASQAASGAGRQLPPPESIPLTLRLPKALVLALLLCAAGAGAAETTFVAKLGKIELNLPIPDGFQPPTHTPPVIVHMLESALPAQDRLLGILMPLPDPDAHTPGIAMDRYYMVQTLRPVEEKGMSPAMYEELKKIFREQSNALLTDKNHLLQEGMEKMSRDAAAQTGDKQFEVKAGKTSRLELVSDEPDLIEFTSVSDVSVATSRTQDSGPIAATYGFMYLRGRLVMAAAYATYRSDDDVDWTKGAMRDWFKRTRELNPAR